MSDETDDGEVELVRSALRKGRSLNEILDEIASITHRELLQRAAVTRVFDAEVFSSILARFPELAGEKTTFEQFVRHPRVEPVPSREGFYRLIDTERQQLLKRWSQPNLTKEFNSLNLILTEYWQDRNELEALYHRLIADPEVARLQFEGYYDQADCVFDLPRCQELLAMLADQRPLQLVLGQLSDRYVARLNARLLWAEDFYKTGRYLERNEAQRLIQQTCVLSQPAQTVLQIHAKGGSGKTMFLRWLTSRWCVPQSVPCAKIDFDVANALQLTSQPHLLALTIARQWNKQLPQTPLAEFIESLANAPERSDPLGELSRTLPVDQLCIIILDTLEEVLIPHPRALQTLLELMSRIQQNNSAVRLVIAGRYNLVERLAEPQLTWLRNNSSTYEIKPFTSEEAQDYLVQLRELPAETDADREVLEAVIGRSEGNPLKLWLYSVLLKESKLDAQAILDDSGVDVEYLIRRVVMRIGERERDPVTRRIPDDLVMLRWVLRYGVVPRRLTRDYLGSEFMIKRLQREIDSQDFQDDTGRGLSRQLQQENVFERRELTGKIDIPHLWQRLKEYASSSSWIRAAESEDALVFTPDIVQPMRNLLLQQEPWLFQELHREARAHFLDKIQAAEKSGRKAGDDVIQCWLQVVYHSFQQNGASAGEYWRNLFESEPFKSRPAWRLALASEVLSRAYVTDELIAQPQLRRDGQYMISRDDLALAYFLQAEAASQMAAQAGQNSQPSSSWDSASRSFQRYLNSRQSLVQGTPGIAEGRAELLGAIIQANVPNGDWRAAIESLRKLRAGAATDELTEQLLSAEIKILLKYSRKEAERAIGQWLQLSRKFTNNSERIEIFKQLALVQAESETFSQAIESIESGIQQARRSRLVETEAFLDLLFRRVLIRCGRSQAAIEPIRLPTGGYSAPKNLPRSWRIAANFHKGQAFLHLLQPAEAVDALASLRGQLRDLERSQQVSKDDAILPSQPAVDELDASIAAACLDHTRAQRLWADARGGWLDLGQHEEADRVALDSVRYMYRQQGELRSAMATVQSLKTRSSISSNLDNSIHSRLFLAEMLILESPDVAHENINECRALCGEKCSSSLLAAVSLASLSYGLADERDRRLDELNQAIAQITPPSARLVTLGDLGHLPTIEGLSLERVSVLSGFVGQPENSPLGVRESACQELLACEVMRVMGRLDLAKNHLERAQAVLLKEGESPAAVRQLLKAKDRLGEHAQAFELGDRWLPLLTDSSTRKDRERSLGAIAWLEQAERSLVLIAKENGTDLAFVSQARSALNEVRRRLSSQDSTLFTLLRARIDRVESEIYRFLEDESNSEFYRVSSRSEFETLGLNVDNLPFAFRLPYERAPAPDPSLSELPLFPVERRVDIAIERLSEKGMMAVASYDRKEAMREGFEPSWFAGVEGEWANSTRVFSLTDEWTKTVQGLAELFPLESDWSSKLGIDPTENWDTCLQLAEGELAIWPWEDAWIARESEDQPVRQRSFFYRSHRRSQPVTIKWMQIVLRRLVEFGLEADGIVGPRLRRAVQAFQSMEGLLPTGQADWLTRTLLHERWRSSREQHKRLAIILGDPESRRGTRNVESGISLETIYAAYGFETRLAKNVEEFVNARRTNANCVFSILHLTGSLAEARSLGTFFEPVARRRWGGRLTARTVVDLLNQLPSDDPCPLVLVNPLSPVVSIQLMRQILLRNAFAHEIFCNHGAVSVLATVAQGNDLMGLIGSLARGVSLGDAASLPSRFSTALYTADPRSLMPGADVPVPLTLHSAKGLVTTRRLFALLVGIDDYPTPFTKLDGCVNDVEFIAEFLHARVGASSGVVPEIRQMVNAEATRQAVIDGFNEYLAQAQKDDIVLFHFSGYGSEERSPRELEATAELEHLNKTLVCYDSRSDNGWDLANHELMTLIENVAQSGAHVAVVLDCCYSDSNQQFCPHMRRAPLDVRSRPIESYLTRYSSRAEGTLLRAESELRKSSGRYILMSACADNEYAYECIGDGKHHGILSFFLVKSLQKSPLIPSYRDLFSRAAALVQSQVSNQSPQLVVSQPVELDRVFLDGAIRPTPSYFTVRYENGDWTIDGGSAYGLPASANSEFITLAIFNTTATRSDIEAMNGVLTKAILTRVLPSVSVIMPERSEPLSNTETYKAVLLYVPVPRAAVTLEGDEEACSLVRQAMASSGPNGLASALIRPADSGEPGELRLIAKDNRYIIARSHSDSPLSECSGWNAANALKIVGRLEQIEYWQQLAQMANPMSSIEPEAIKLSIIVAGKEVTTPTVRLVRNSMDPVLTEPTFRVSLTNRSQRTLFCAVLNLGPLFDVQLIDVPDSLCLRLRPSETVYLSDGRELTTVVPDELKARGVFQCNYLLKLIVCNQEFDSRLVEWRRAGVPTDKGQFWGWQSLLQDSASGISKPTEIVDWQAWQYSFTTVESAENGMLS